ncbi:MAG: hypothetical protein P8J45_10165 [Phycisphaerales bacterium]|jgi:hypothetical protein|nr:hypothetical protein [Phycisphaerales bacterium]
MTMQSRQPATSGQRRILTGLLPLFVGSLLLGGCYQRVVHDRQGNYVGTVYEGNLPDDSRGFWSDISDTNQVVPKTRSEESQRVQDRYQEIYDRQTKGLDLGSGNR